MCRGSQSGGLLITYLEDQHQNPARSENPVKLGEYPVIAVTESGNARRNLGQARCVQLPKFTGSSGKLTGKPGR